MYRGFLPVLLCVAVHAFDYDDATPHATQEVDSAPRGAPGGTSQKKSAIHGTAEDSSLVETKAEAASHEVPEKAPTADAGPKTRPPEQRLRLKEAVVSTAAGRRYVLEGAKADWALMTEARGAICDLWKKRGWCKSRAYVPRHCPTQCSRGWKKMRSTATATKCPRCAFHAGLTGPTFPGLLLPNGKPASPTWYVPYQEQPLDKQYIKHNCNPASCNNPSECGIPVCRGFENIEEISLHAAATVRKSHAAWRKFIQYCPAATGKGANCPTLQTITSKPEHSSKMATKIGNVVRPFTFFAMFLPGIRVGTVFDIRNPMAHLICFPTVLDTQRGGAAWGWGYPGPRSSNPLSFTACAKGSIAHVGLDPYHGNTRMAHHSAVVLTKSNWCVRPKCKKGGLKCPSSVCYAAKKARCVEFTHRVWKVHPSWGDYSYNIHSTTKEIVDALKQLRNGNYKDCQSKAKMAMAKLLSIS